MQADPPQYVQPQPDPLFQQLQSQAQQDQTTAIQTTLKGDTAALLMRYGQRVAMAGPGATAVLSTGGTPYGR